MTRSHDVVCFFFGWAVGVVASLVLVPDSRQSAIMYLGKKATRGVDYATTQAENAREVVDSAAARAEKIIDRVNLGLDSAKTVIAAVGRS